MHLLIRGPLGQKNCVFVFFVVIVHAAQIKSVNTHQKSATLRVCRHPYSFLPHLASGGQRMVQAEGAKGESCAKGNKHEEVNCTTGGHNGL